MTLRSIRSFVAHVGVAIRTNASIVICAFAAWPGLAFGQGQQKPRTLAPTVIVTVGRPNVWTMEQAHYLLEKNRAHDFGIAAACFQSIATRFQREYCGDWIHHG